MFGCIKLLWFIDDPDRDRECLYNETGHALSLQSTLQSKINHANP